MRVFLLNEKRLSVIDKKEEITDDTFLIDDVEYEHIKETLANNGYFWRIDKYTIGYSGIAPSQDHKWNNETHEWELCEKLRQQRIDDELNRIWKSIQIKRLASSYTGVKVEEYWFHSTVEARARYDDIARSIQLDIFNETQWKTMSGEFVTMTLDLFKKLTKALIDKAQHDFNNAEQLYKDAQKLNFPTMLDLDKGWSKGYGA